MPSIAIALLENLTLRDQRLEGFLDLVGAVGVVVTERELDLGQRDRLRLGTACVVSDHGADALLEVGHLVGILDSPDK